MCISNKVGVRLNTFDIIAPKTRQEKFRDRESETDGFFILISTPQL